MKFQARGSVLAKQIEISETELKERIGDLKGAKKYKVVSNYIVEKLGKSITFSDQELGTKSPLTDFQAEHITDYVDNHDAVLDVVKHKDGGIRVFVSKKTENGYIVVVELVSKGRKALHPVTGWQNTTDAFNAHWGNKKGTLSTSQPKNLDQSGYTEVPNNSIRDDAKIVNTSGEKNSSRNVGCTMMCDTW